LHKFSQAKELASATVTAGERLGSLNSVSAAKLLQARRLRADVLLEGSDATATDWMQAKLIYEDVLTEQVATLGTAHENTLTTKNNLAALCKTKLGNLTIAVELEMEVIAGCKQLFGPNHEKTTVARMNYGNTLHRMGKYRPALKEFTEAADGFERGLGRLSPRTLKAQHNLALVLDKVGRSEEALALMKTVYQGRVDVFGADAPPTRSSLSQLDSWMQD
jgi:tetratricopeptide (TPR) repeat protein